MIDIIHRLPDSVANQIAAGEVIQNPASVVKELVENAVDAGATHIQIVIKDAGRTLIQVVDNGKGMTLTDARMAFKRHATSKINVADDLEKLQTMGFRGEALPSICAISQVDLFTQPHDEKMGTHLTIHGSQVISQVPDVCTPGSNFMVKNLFYNTPARRKFLRSDATETAAIMREFERLALVNFNIRISLDVGTRHIDLRPGSFKQRIGDIWKNNLNLQLIPIDVDTSVGRITGFVSRPEFARRRNALQFLIVNGRNMKHPYFRKAVISAYDGLIAADTQPCFFLRFEVDPATIDVNIHPQKQEIKFQNELTIWPILKASVRAALGRFGAAPSIDFTSDPITVAPLRKGETAPEPEQDVNPEYNPFADEVPDINPFTQSAAKAQGTARRSTQASYPGNGTSVPRDWEQLYRTFMGGDESAENPSEEMAAAAQPMQQPRQETLPELKSGREHRPCIQLSDKYILTPGDDELLVIDQYRAHLLILFEDYMARFRASGEHPAMQRLLFPETIQLDEAQSTQLEEIRPALQSLGFELEPVDGGSWSLTGIPAFINGCSAADLVTGALACSDYDSPDYGADESDTGQALTHRVALAAARATAIRGGQRLSPEEMAEITDRLLRLDNPLFTPSGNPTLHTLPLSYFTSLFR